MEKKQTNTEWLAKKLAQFADIPVRDVSFAGLKDREAVTIQWFSLRIPGKRELDWALFSDDNIRILQVGRHQKKLRRGHLIGNKFRLILKNCQGDKAFWQQRLEYIQTGGVPNYFGPQRFGREGHNVQAAFDMFAGKRVKRQQKSIYLSALRAYFFNHVLSKRLEQKLTLTPMTGDIMNLTGSNSVFAVNNLNEDNDAKNELEKRLSDRDIVLTGPLVGQGKNNERINTPASRFEQSALIDAGYDESCQKNLIKYKLGADRRPLWVYLDNFSWDWLNESTLELKFFLPKGSFATSVLRELARYQIPDK
ncbi:tRNA pseudouridine(13) synthase TruD [Piscirickettsia litoralis]|uniref:tRNA pseudouridine(13) synthase TruD n=1 Tax=Piscirickettsia litoralis TaxID=1891921 RepID=UPI0029391695|nr:tRNA pseudouridine(13) synthase TruD [Piscirickettsia litoralis]